MLASSLDLKLVMRNWATGVTVVTSAFEGNMHGMTVSSFTSVSVEPPVIVVTLAKRTRTHAMVQDSGKLGITILAKNQSSISDIFAGKIPEDGNRFDGVDTFTLDGEIPLIKNGLAWLVCEIKQTVDLNHSTMFLAGVTHTQIQGGDPLIYLNQTYRSLKRQP